jgi:hypothetical protein
MVLNKLKIELAASYKPNAGQYEGVAEFTDAAGNVQLKLTPEMCDRIFMICADGILTVAKEAAANLTCNVIEHKAALDLHNANVCGLPHGKD